MVTSMFLGRTDFSDRFRKIIIRHKRIGCDLNVMRQSACLVFNPITVDNFAALFSCTSVDRASDSMMAPTGAQLMIFFASEFQWWCLAVQGFPTVTQHVVSAESLLLHSIKT